VSHGIKIILRAVVITAVGGAIALQLAGPLAVAVVAVAAIAFELSRIRTTLLRRLDELGADLAQVEPLVALERRLETRRPLPPMRGFAIAPDFALALTELIADERPEIVVETGSGVSTLVIAYCLERLGRGRVIALEHDPRYAERTRAEIDRHGLARYATVVDAPLEPIEIDGERYRWHAPRALAGLPPIDLVVDDGPPRYLGATRRCPSWPSA
jgi:methyltransferase family protein